MPFIEPVFVGIDTTSGRTSFTYAALDDDRRILALAEGELQDVLSFLEKQPSAVVAINSPASINLGLVGKKMRKEAAAEQKLRGAQMRMVEYELRKHGISVSGTPSIVAACPPWVQIGFGLYRALKKMGFVQYPNADSRRQVLETHPHACYCILAETIPQPKPSLEGRLQRQLILHEHGVQVRDPMDFFEEITRHKMIKGVWPMELLYSAEQLDALVAAYTAWAAINKKEKILELGDKKEGRIILPENELKDNY